VSENIKDVSLLRYKIHENHDNGLLVTQDEGKLGLLAVDENDGLASSFHVSAI
jgi:hypothetical protein